MICDKCGTELAEGAMFCKACGKMTDVLVKALTPEPEKTSDNAATQQAAEHNAQQDAPPSEPPEFALLDEEISEFSEIESSSDRRRKRKQIPIIYKIAAIAFIIATSVYFVFFFGAGGTLGGDSVDNNNIVIDLKQTPSKIRILKELSEDERSLIPQAQSIDTLEVTKASTSRRAGTHRADIIITSYDDSASYIRYAVIIYERNAEREWILSEIVADKPSMWSVTPLAKTSELTVDSAVRETLLEQRFSIDDYYWHIKSDTIAHVAIVSQITDLENGKDMVIANVVFGSEVLTSHGQLELNFEFGEEGWLLSGYNIFTPFISEYMPNAEFELTNEVLLDDLMRADIEMWHENHYIFVSRELISNLTINGYSSSNMGVNRVYTFTFNIESGDILFAVNAEAFYRFDSLIGWIPGREGAGRFTTLGDEFDFETRIIN